MGLSMRILPVDFRMTAATVLLPAMIISSTAIGGEVANHDSTSNLAPAKIAEAAIPASPAADTAPRQHVKHLRAHKKFDAFAPDDAAQTAQKPDAGKTSASSASAQKNLSAENGAAARPTAKPRVKIARQRMEKTIKEQTGASENMQRPRQRDFISDIFGGDE